MVVTSTPSTPLRWALVVLLLVWLAAGAVGWLIHGALSGVARGEPGRTGLWLACVIVVVALGALATRALPARVRGDPAVCWAAFVGVGWAIAIAAGWFVGVEVGGPTTGLVAGLGVGAASAGAHIPRVASVAGCAFVAIVGCRLLIGDELPLVGLVVPTLGGLLVLAAAQRVLLQDLRLRPVVDIMCAWAAAWVGTWALTSTVIAPVSFGLSVGAEIVVAVALGAVALGSVTRRATGEPVWRVAGRWTAASTIALIVGAAAALLLRDVATDGSAGVFAHLDVGTVVGLGAAAGFAALPTVRLTASARRSSRTVTA